MDYCEQAAFCFMQFSHIHLSPPFAALGGEQFTGLALHVDQWFGLVQTNYCNKYYSTKAALCFVPS